MQVTVGCSTVDIVRHLSSEEISRVPPGAISDRMARLSGHLVGQRRYLLLWLSPLACEVLTSEAHHGSICFFTVAIISERQLSSRYSETAL